MLVKILGAVDLIIGIILMFSSGLKIASSISIILAVFLFIKAGTGLFKGFASWIDLFAGVVFVLLVFFPVYWAVCMVAGILLIQKGIVSFL
jgi:hypothetical protein